ncbi:MAG: hypothetical protein ABIN89_09600 [Chitinophagaceae bacterium]
MENNSNGTSDAFMEVVVKKIELQDLKLFDLETRLTTDADHATQIKHLITSVEGLRTAINSGQSPNRLQEFSTRLALAINLLQKPIENKVNHHHHIPKLTWITAGLFLLFSMVCSGWYMTTEKLDSFIANDTKYRQLKLDSANKRLQADLDVVDSLYQVKPDLKEMVIQKEERNKKNLELLQKAILMENEANELKKKVNKGK